MVIGKVAVDIVSGLVPADADVLRQGKFGNTVDNAEIDCLGVAALQGRHLVRRHAEDLAGRSRMNVQAVTECPLHGFIVRNMGKHTQLDLAVVRIYQHAARLGDEHLPDLRAQVRPDGDILQIWVCGGKPPGSRHQILEGGVNTPIGANNLHQAVSIGALEFGQHPVVHNGRNNGVLVLELFQHIGIGGIAGFGLLPGGQAQLFEEQGSQLLGRLDIEGTIGIAVNQCLAVRDPLFQHFAELGQLVPVNGNAQPLHSVEHGAQGQLDLIVKRCLALLFQLLLQRLCQKPDGFGTGCGIPILHGFAQECGCQLGNGIVRLGGVQVIGGKRRVEAHAAIGNASLFQQVHGGPGIVEHQRLHLWQRRHVQLHRRQSAHAIFPGNAQAAVRRKIEGALG